MGYKESRRLGFFLSSGLLIVVSSCENWKSESRQSTVGFDGALPLTRKLHREVSVMLSGAFSFRASALFIIWTVLLYSHHVLFHRLASWFAYHLSNYEFRWTWEDWSDSLQVDKEHPKAKFVTEILQGCIRCVKFLTDTPNPLPRITVRFLMRSSILFADCPITIASPKSFRSVSRFSCRRSPFWSGNLTLRIQVPFLFCSPIRPSSVS